MKLTIPFPAILLCLIACQPSPKETSINIADDGDPQFATSPFGMVAAAQPLATNAGKAMLDMGGNAADAAVAAAFVIAVVEPTMNGIGGRNQILVRNADGSFQGYNGMTEIPKGYTAPETPVSSGHGTIATPGVVATLMRLHEEHGSLPLTQIMESAINYAAEGFQVLPGEAARHKYGRDDIMKDPGFRGQILKDDSITYEAGEILKQPDLANTLKRIADSKGRDFYEGEIAVKIAADMEANGGFVTLEDLKNYKALDARYVTTDYREYQIHSVAAPAGGGLVVKALNVMEQFDLSEMDNVQWATIVNQSLAAAIRTMQTDYKEEDLEVVQSKEWAKEQARFIVVPEPTAAETTSLLEQKTAPLIAEATDWSGETWGEESHHTTHFVTADCNGMVVSITQTVGPLFGSKVITPGLGFVYASTMGAYLSILNQAPGSRPRTTIAPTVVTKDGEIVMVLGAAGGLRILSGIVQTISRHIDQGMSARSAVAAPRVHPETERDQETDQTIVYGNKFSAEFTPENGWGASDSIAWQEAGFEVTSIERYGAFSRVHAIARDAETNEWMGVADLDWEGTAEGPETSGCEN